MYPPLSAMWATSFIGLRPPPSAVGYVGNLLHWLTSTPLLCRLCGYSPSLAYVHPPPLSAMWATSFIGLRPPHSSVGYVGTLLHWLTSTPLRCRLCWHSFIGLRTPPSVVGYVGNLLHWPTYTPLRCRLCGRPPSLAYVHPTPLSAMWATSFIGLRTPPSVVGYVGALLHWLTSTPLRCRLIEHTPSLAYVHPTPLWLCGQPPSLAYVHPTPLWLCGQPPSLAYVHPTPLWLCGQPPSLAYVYPTPLSAMWAPSFIGLRPPHSAVG